MQNYENSFTSEKNANQPQVIGLEYRVYKSFTGKYFMGHTPQICLGANSNAWSGLLNPANSGVNLYVNTFAVTNTSALPFQAQLWLNSSPLGNAAVSSHFSPANTAFIPLPKPKSLLAYSQYVPATPMNGVSILSRIAEANSTTVGNYYGKIVIPPGGTFIVFLHSPGTQYIKTEVAFGWWEE